jgi:hypothetical protein
LKATMDVPSAVVVRTLNRPDVAIYLESNAPKFGGLRQALHAEPALWEIMDTPLMLWVGAFAFEHDAGLEPTDGKPIRERLFDRYVDAMLKRTEGKTSRAAQRPFRSPTLSSGYIKRLSA